MGGVGGGGWGWGVGDVLASWDRSSTITFGWGCGDRCGVVIVILWVVVGSANGRIKLDGDVFQGP